MANTGLSELVRAQAHVPAVAAALPSAEPAGLRDRRAALATIRAPLGRPLRGAGVARSAKPHSSWWSSAFPSPLTQQQSIAIRSERRDGRQALFQALPAPLGTPCRQRAAWPRHERPAR